MRAMVLQRVVRAHADGLVDAVYSLWNRNPITISRTYTVSKGTKDRPKRANRRSY